MTTIVGVTNGVVTAIAADGLVVSEGGLVVGRDCRKISVGSGVIVGLASGSVLAIDIACRATGSALNRLEFCEAMREAMESSGAQGSDEPGLKRYDVGGVVCEVASGKIWTMDDCLGFSEAMLFGENVRVATAGTGSEIALATARAMIQMPVIPGECRSVHEVAEGAVRAAIDLDIFTGGLIHVVTVKGGEVLGARMVDRGCSVGVT